MAETFYIDSNVFIFPVIYDNEKAIKATEILNKIENKEIIAYTSVLTWDEVVYIVNKIMGKADSVSTGKKFLNYPNLRFISVDINIIARAQKIVEDYNIKPRDAIHISSALSKNIHNIISDDSDFDFVHLINRIKLE
ncbi:type II toxin-antitoxin system VapC family toxin [Picrophilus oshimae]|uniref:PIN domain-containing protein n=1 Tax=Picrophilus torridus (strain ATCC 700027 / DSM 9790 / JCM 10055 / NBRC 100828 / KAW 2/3) TaxID=1122961 RepID=A0A8G2FXN7_PICTO|nr:type II toxin-antitoxin system VapC family toxin [Picrophilus oshimae]SMD31427.1 hypothetical protein SAMN02745355_1366 [Picrophilus oshimae DSM 9789]